MQILFHTTEKAEALNTKILLELRGIPTFIGSENSGPAFGFIAANKYTIWVCLDEQYQDAVALLDNPDHEVTTGIDVDEYYKAVEEQTKKTTNKTKDGLMLGLVLFAIFIFVIWAYGRGVFSGAGN